MEKKLIWDLLDVVYTGKSVSNIFALIENNLLQIYLFN